MSEPEEGPSTRRSTTKGHLVLFNKEDLNDTYRISSSDELAKWVRKDSKLAYDALLMKQSVWSAERKRFHDEAAQAQDAAALSAEDAAQAHGEADEAADRIRTGNAEAEALRERVQSLERALNGQREEGATLIDKLTAAERKAQDLNQALEHVKNERNRLVYEATQVTRGRTATTPATVATDEGLGQKRSARMPDPPMFSDGKEIRWDNWQTQIDFKLSQNADWFPTPQHQINYVLSRCEGRAMKHISPRMHRNSTNRYADVDELMNHLAEIFEDPNRREAARQEYETLKQKPKDEFPDFLAEYARLAEEADIPTQDRKRGLYHKLTWKLQDRVTAYAIDPNLTYLDFIRRCQDTASMLSINSKNNPLPIRGVNKEKDKDKPTGSGPPRSRLDPTEHAQLLKEGKCFICKKEGHRSRDCPDKKIPTVAAATQAALEGQSDPRLVAMEAHQSENE